VQALEVPEGSPATPGIVQTIDRAELVGEVVSSQWQWLSPSNAKRRSQILNRALSQRTPAVGRPRARATSAAPRRLDIADGVLSVNPYDDVLTWLSELESGRCSASAFRDAWAWCCESYEMPNLASEWRLALNKFVGLGHVERDYRRQQVAVAPAALVDLPNAKGLSLLTGARPLRLLERMNDEEDVVVAVADGAGCWVMQSRTPTERGAPAGPAAIYVDWARTARATVTEALTALGVAVTGLTTDALLDALPHLESALKVAITYTTSPSQDVWLRERSGHMTYRWTPRATDAAAGLYRYRLRHGDVFAFRGVLGAELRKVNRHTGLWLDTKRQEPTGVVAHHALRQCLLVPANLPLPPLLHRALVLRTGLPPWTTLGFRPDGHGPGHAYHAYDNVNADVADTAAALLGQPSWSVHDTLQEAGAQP
jgi:hypothetical protein